MVLLADFETDLGGGDGAPDNFFDVHPVVVEGEFVEFGLKFGGRPPGVDEGAQKHVAGRSGEGVEKRDLQEGPPVVRQIWAAK